MNIPTFVQGRPLDDSGNWTKQWQMLWDQLLQKMQISLSDEGFVIPSQNQANINTIATGKNPDGSYICMPGTVLFNTEAQDGLGQLQVFMNDHTFHGITNS